MFLQLPTIMDYHNNYIVKDFQDVIQQPLSPDEEEEVFKTQNYNSEDTDLNSSNEEISSSASSIISNGTDGSKSNLFINQFKKCLVVEEACKASGILASGSRSKVLESHVKVSGKACRRIQFCWGRIPSIITFDKQPTRSSLIFVRATSGKSRLPIFEEPMRTRR